MSKIESQKINRWAQNHIICHACDQLMHMPKLSPGQNAHCNRCDAELISMPDFRLSGLLALTIATLLMYIPANAFPIISIEFFGSERNATIASAAITLIKQDFFIVGVTVFLSAVVAPLLYLSNILLQIILLKQTMLSKWQFSILKRQLIIHQTFSEFTMLEIYLLSFCVSVFKLTDFSDVYFGVGTLSFMLLLIMTYFVRREYSHFHMWQAYGEKKKQFETYGYQ